MVSKKELRRQRIKESARKLFINKSIEQTTFSEIARGAGVGEATVYRHFENKGALAMTIALDYSTQFSKHLVQLLEDHKGSHLEQFEEILNYYMKLFIEQPDYFIYLEHFDNYIIHSSEKPEGFDAYEEQFAKITKVICDIGGGELVDESVKRDIDIELITYTFNIAFLSLCQKLLLRGRVIEVDRRYDQLKELELMKDMMINSLRA